MLPAIEISVPIERRRWRLPRKDVSPGGGLTEVLLHHRVTVRLTRLLSLLPDSSRILSRHQHNALDAMNHRQNRALTTASLGLLSLTLAGCGPNLFERIGNFWTLSCCGVVIVVLDVVALLELAGDTRSTGSKIAWGLLIIFFPVLGVILYYFFGRS